MAAHCPAADLDFYRDIYPFLKANCIACHNKTTTKADLNMETPELMIQGGESGPSIVPGKSADSLVVLASLHQQDLEMPPPNNKSGAVNLTEAEIALLKQWIDQGAKSSVQQERAVTRQTLSASVDPIYAVALSPDGRLAACGRGARVFLYDLATRQAVGQLADPALATGAAHRDLVQSLAFSPDGARLASGSFREVKLWKLDPATTAAAAPSQAATAAPDPSIVQKLAAAGKVTVLSSAQSPDGRLIAAACTDGSVRLWEIATAKPVAELRGSLEATQRTAALERVVAAQTLEQAFHRSELARIDAQDKALDVLLGKAKEAIVAMQKVLPEKQKAVPPATTAREAAQKAVDELAAKIAALPAGKTDAALDRELKTAQDKLITTKMAEVSAQAAVSAAESNVKDAEDEVKRITDLKAKNAAAVAAANQAITAAKTAQDKAAADLAALRQKPAPAGSKPQAVVFSADSQRVAALLEDGSLRVWAAATGLVLDEKAAPAASTTLAPAADGSFIATRTLTVSAGAAPRWALERALQEKGWFADRVNAVRFSPDGKWLATGSGEPSRSGDIVLFETATGKPLHTWKERHSDSVLCLDFSPDGKRLASGAADKIARVTEIATGRQVNLFEGHTHHVTGIAFRSDGRVLATAGADGTVVTWDMLIGERKKKIEGWTKEVTSLQFIGATNQIITSAGDNRVRIVNDEGAEVRNISDLPDYMQAAVSTPNGGILVAGGEDSLLRVWDATGKAVASFGTK